MNFSVETQSYGFDWSGIIISFAVKNISSIQVVMVDDNSQYNIFVNGELMEVITSTGENQLYYPTNFSLKPENPYFIQITRKTEAQNNAYAADFFGVLISEYGYLLQSNPKPSRKIEFLGDSITCGFGNLGPSSVCIENPQLQLEDNWQTYGAMIARQFDAEYHIECWSGIGVVRNYGSPNITSTDPFPVYFNRTIAMSTLPTYPFEEFKPNAVICNLGTNDYSTEPSPPQHVFEQGYRGLIKQIREAYGESVPLFLVCGPMITGECCTYVQNIVNMEPNTYYINLQNILETQEIGCDGHPNVQGHQKMAYLSLPIIQNVLGW